MAGLAKRPMSRGSTSSRRWTSGGSRRALDPRAVRGPAAEPGNATGTRRS
jgi:hypothetical protein